MQTPKEECDFIGVGCRVVVKLTIKYELIVMIVNGFNR